MQAEHYLIVGLGITGLSVVNYLDKRGDKFSITDSRSNPPHLADLTVRADNLLLGEITVPDSVTTIILSPGVASNEPALQAAARRGIPIIGDIELFARVVDKPVLAITGSNGKSTVTTVLGLMAAASGIKAGVGGNLGTPALALLDPSNQCYILELSSFQLETTYTLRPKVATVLNLSPDHMDRYAELTDYQSAKLRIYHDAECVVYNREDIMTQVPATYNPETVISFGLDQANNTNYGVTIKNGQGYLACGAETLMPLSELGMLGQHNIANALACLAMGAAAGFKKTAMLKVLQEFKGLEHRCEHVLTDQNVVWINDSKGTNVGATVTAIQGLASAIDGKWIVILGGVGKNADFSALVPVVQAHCRAAILIGTEADNLRQLLSPVVACYTATDMAMVIDIAQSQARNGDGVLLSPACASFDMFDNYAHRGAIFKQLVLQRIGRQNAKSTAT